MDLQIIVENVRQALMFSAAAHALPSIPFGRSLTYGRKPFYNIFLKLL